MVQAEIRDQILKLRNVIAGNTLTCEEVIRNRRIDTGIFLVQTTELGGKVPLGSHVSVEEYGTLEDKLDYGTEKST